MYARDTLFVASDSTPKTRLYCTTQQRVLAFLPASVRFPLLVKLVFRAPVPA